MKKGKYLITGCAGFIGFHVCKQLLNMGSFIIGLDNLNDYKDLFMAVVKGKTTELDEAKSPQIQGTSKESRQFF